MASEQEKAVESSGREEQEKTSHDPVLPEDVERGTKIRKEVVIESLYESAFSGHWTKESIKFFKEIPRKERVNDFKLKQLVALNIAAMVSKWDFILDMLRRMSMADRNKVLTDLTPDDVRWIRCEVNVYLERKTGKDYSEHHKCLDGSPHSLMLAAATLGLFDLTDELAFYIHIRNPAHAGPVLGQIVDAGFYDVAYLLCQRYPKLSLARITPWDDWADEVSDEISIQTYSGPRWTMLHLLAERSEAFRSCRYEGGVHNSYGFVMRDSREVKNSNWKAKLLLFLRPIMAKVCPQIVSGFEQEERCLSAEMLLKIMKREIRQVERYSPGMYRDELSWVIKTAAQHGIFEIVNMCLKIFPSLVWDKDGSRHILHDAIKYRHEKVFNLIRDRLLEDRLQVNSFWRGFEDIMILAASPPLPQTLEHIAGSALKMQKELQWFAEVENVAFFINHGEANKTKGNARLLFVENRQKLVKEGEKWMKSAATSCTVVAALVVTVVYQAAFQIPGGTGTDEKKVGIANLLNQHDKHLLFSIFSLSDVISLFFSSTSLLLFLSILTSRFSADDFRYILPNRLILGLTALFIALAAMVTSFTATILIVLGPKMKLLKYLALCGVALPVTLFVLLQLPLFFALVRSTYFRRRPKRKF
uniref:PGG domain-containing protein n=1 Tax=Kalanchoe fedtschenkoi TaxID=63787 RepID=A0A7N0UDU9_KALFE